MQNMPPQQPPPFQQPAPPFQPAPSFQQPAPPPRTGRRWLPIVLVSILVLLVLCIGGVALFVGVIVKSTSGPRDTATAYFAAIAAHDWQKASSYDSAGTSAADLEQSWTQTEAENGRLQSSSVSNTSINNNEATVSGTLRFANGTRNFSVDMVKVGDAWKLK